MITGLLGHLSPLRYVVIEEKTLIDIGQMLPLSTSQRVAFRIFGGRVIDDLLCFHNPLRQDDMDDLEKYGVIDLWIIADKIDELFPDENGRQRIHTSMARLHVY
ncbi:hypothetical protein G6L37_11785 [Agrobacterium rubi]|uniref:hypothetical protein n=1 Tax=Agrobacterium rubi TaxID=28099 RepID=UPI001572B2C4|nr:hypothetical protein [Agrobacterium rubi]NTF06842.1 hypothetical protein [Agrobacterium rubi]NTF19084.1 hypothetical protein [Agrobacterium rubi]NTF26047.1 hypothetical protein [Agrobacterium rubi]